MSVFRRLRQLFRHQGLAGFLARGFAGSAGLKVLQVFLSLALSVLLARMLGPEGYGIYAFAFSIVTLVSVPGQLGLPMLMVREVARYQQAAHWGRLRGLLVRSNQLGLLSSIVILVACYGYLLLFNGGDLEQRATLMWALALVPLITLGNLRGAILRGLRKVLQGQLPEMLVRPALLVLLLVAALLFRWPLSPADAMLLHCVAALLAFLLGAGMLMRALPGEVRAAKTCYETRAWVRSLLPLSFIAGMQVINSQADIFMLGVMTSKEEVGAYRVAAQGATLVMLASTAVNVVIAPQITRLYHAGEMARLQRMVTLSARLILAASLPLALLFIIFAKPLIGLVFGADFVMAALALAILCGGQLFSSAVGSVGFLLNMTGHESDAARGMILAVLVNILLNFLLIPKYGINGSAVATAASLVVWNVLLFIRVWRHLRIDSSALAFLRPGK